MRSRSRSPHPTPRSSATRSRRIRPLPQHRLAGVIPGRKGTRSSRSQSYDVSARSGSPSWSLPPVPSWPYRPSCPLVSPHPHSGANRSHGPGWHARPQAPGTLERLRSTPFSSGSRAVGRSSSAGPGTRRPLP
ncbi:DUF6411 family protein [Streptomyces sp. NPDC002778]